MLQKGCLTLFNVTVQSALLVLLKNVLRGVAPCSLIGTDRFSIAVMTAAVNISETSVVIYQTTWQNVLEDNQFILDAVRT